MNPQEMLDDWRLRAKRQCHAHTRTAAFYDRCRKLVGIPSIVLSTIVGTAVFSEASHDASSSYKFIVVGMVLAAAALSAMQTFLRLEELAGRHGAASNTFSSLRRKLDLAQVRLHSGRLSPVEMEELLEELRGQFDEAVNGVPPIPQRIWDIVDKKHPRS